MIPDKSILVTADDIGIRRDARWLIRNVDLSVHRGEIVTLIGPNGSGKSTSAKTILGLLHPDEGKVQRSPGLRIGYVPQKLHINWSLPLNVTRFMHLTAAYDVADITDALTACGIEHLRHAQVQNLSGGEFQRILIARAILGKPDLLVLDEPVQGVDFTGEVALYELIAKIRHDIGCGTLLISHDLHIVMAQTDTVVCLNGHVCCHGSPKAVATNPEYQKLFGARAAEALAIYHHDHDHTHADDGSLLNTESGCTSHHREP